MATAIGTGPRAQIERLRGSLKRANAKNAALRRSVGRVREREAATAEILRVISSFPVDVQPVFEAIARNAVALCGSVFANFYGDDEKAKEAGATAYLAKPYSPFDLLNLIRKLLPES